MWQYRNYSDELYHHKYIERISVSGGYRYVYPDDNKGSGKKRVYPGTSKHLPPDAGKPGSNSYILTIKDPNPRVNVGSKVTTSPASVRPYLQKTGQKATTHDIYSSVRDVGDKTLEEAKSGLGGIFDKVKETIGGIVNSVTDTVKAKMWSKEFNKPTDLYGKKNAKYDKKPIDSWSSNIWVKGTPYSKQSRNRKK